MKKIIKKTPPFLRGAILGAAAGVTLVVLQGAPAAQALSIPAPRDCDPNSIINCGALTTAELQQRYGNSGVPEVFSYFGISSQEIKAIGGTAVAGLVHRDGTVKVNGKIVATGAITAGRLNIAGSTRVTSGGVTFYKRPPSVSFASNSLAAYVVLTNGRFDYAVLASCGNPVIATPVPTPKPPVTPTKPEVPVTPVTPETPPPTVTTVSAAKPVELPVELPQTGPKEALTVAILAVLGGVSFHMLHRHIRRRRAIKKHSAHSARRAASRAAARATR